MITDNPTPAVCRNTFATMQSNVPTAVRTEQRRPKRVSRAQALVDFGLADSLADARAQLRDMGE